MILSTFDTVCHLCGFYLFISTIARTYTNKDSDEDVDRLSPNINKKVVLSETDSLSLFIAPL